MTRISCPTPEEWALIFTTLQNTKYEDTVKVLREKSNAPMMARDLFDRIDIKELGPRRINNKLKKAGAPWRIRRTDGASMGWLTNPPHSERLMAFVPATDSCR